MGRLLADETGAPGQREAGPREAGPHEAGPRQPCQRQAYAPGATILEADAVNPRILILESGFAAIGRRMPDGRRIVIELAGPDDFLAPPDALAASMAAEALTRCVVRAIRPADWFAQPQGQGDAAARLARQLRRLQAHAAILARREAGSRLAAFLLDLARRGEETGQPIPLDRRTIADHLGLTTESVSRHFARWRREGVLSYGQNGAVRVDRREALDRQAHGGEGGAPP